jgi:hypothetical protein
VLCLLCFFVVWSLDVSMHIGLRAVSVTCFRGMVTRRKYAYRSSCCVCYVFLIVTTIVSTIEMGRKFVVKSTSIKCNENLMISSRIHAERLKTVSVGASHKY